VAHRRVTLAQRLAQCGFERAQPGHDESTNGSDLGVCASRLSESNRRPIHYESVRGARREVRNGL
jgi:hypothetical protein